MTQGDILILDAISEHNRPLISKLTEMGAVITNEENGTGVGPKVLKPTDVKTMPHPGFPTDMQAQMTAIQMLAKVRLLLKRSLKIVSNTWKKCAG